MEVASSVEQRGWKGDLEIKIVHFPSFQVELSKFWRDPASELSDVFANEVFCLAGVASMGCNCINIDITTIIIVFTNASVGVISENFLTCRDATKAHRLPI